MIKRIVKEFIEGRFRYVEYVKYRNGRMVKRILNNETFIPEGFVVIKEGTK